MSLVEAQKLGRHCDPKLIANHYTHLSLHDLTNAVSRLAAPRTTDRAREAMRATGTDETRAKSLSPNLAQTGDNRGETLTTVENSPVAKFNAKCRPPEMQKPRKIRSFEHVGESLTTPEKSTEGGSRTHTPNEGYGILNPAQRGLNIQAAKEVAARATFTGTTTGPKCGELVTADENAKRDAIGSERGQELDTELARIVAAWSELPAVLKGAMLAIVDSAGAGERGGAGGK